MSSHRAFVLNNFHEVKALNPTFPFLIRESQGHEPRFDVRNTPLANYMYICKTLSTWCVV